VFARHPEKMTDERMEEIRNLVKEKIPGHDFDTFHLPIFHHDEVCLPGDIFQHENAKKYHELHKIERKYPTYHHDIDHEDDGQMWDDSSDAQIDDYMFNEEDPDVDEHEGSYELSQEEID